MDFLFFVAGLVIIPVTILFILLNLISLPPILFVCWRKKKYKFLKRYLLIDGVTFAVLSALTALLILASLPPSSEKLIKNYMTHREEFNSMVKKIDKDQKKGLARIDDTWTSPEDLSKIGITDKELSQYRSELRSLGVPRGFYSFPHNVRFISYTFGLSISGSSMGYLYSTEVPKNYIKENDCHYPETPFKNLKDYKGCNGITHSYTIYQSIDKNWYIWEDLED